MNAERVAAAAAVCCFMLMMQKPHEMLFTQKLSNELFICSTCGCCLLLLSKRESGKANENSQMQLSINEWKWNLFN